MAHTCVIGGINARTFGSAVARCIFCNHVCNSSWRHDASSITCGLLPPLTIRAAIYLARQ